MKKLLLILLACLPLFLAAREKKDNSNPKYLAGAVTLTEGRVSFSKEIKAPSLSKDVIYKQMLEWANERFQPKDKLQSRVVYTDEEKGEIAVSAEEYIVFSSSALSLDRTRIYYQLFIYTKKSEYLHNIDDTHCCTVETKWLNDGKYTFQHRRHRRAEFNPCIRKIPWRRT